MKALLQTHKTYSKFTHKVEICQKKSNSLQNQCVATSLKEIKGGLSRLIVIIKLSVYTSVMLINISFSPFMDEYNT